MAAGMLGVRRRSRLISSRAIWRHRFHGRSRVVRFWTRSITSCKATRSAVKRYGDQPSLHLAQVPAASGRNASVRRGTGQPPGYGLASIPQIRGWREGGTVLKAADDRKVVLIELQTRLEPAHLKSIADARKVTPGQRVTTPKVDPSETQNMWLQEAPPGPPEPHGLWLRSLPRTTSST